MDLFERGQIELANDGLRLAQFTMEALPLLHGDYRNELMMLLAKHTGTSNYDDKVVIVTDTHVLHCPNCKAKYTDGETSCDVCGHDDLSRRLDFHSLPPAFSHKGTPSGITADVAKPGYTRRPFFIERLKALTGRKREIPDEIYTLVYNEAKKCNYKVLNRRLVRSILSANKRADMYDCAIFIASQFNGVPPPDFTQDQIATLVSMFEDVEAMFEVCPPHIKGRTSMIGYYYLIYKFCHLLEWDKYLPYIQMPQKPTYEMYDVIWKWFCGTRTKEPLWTFYPTKPEQDD
jgi:hypothetical protein